MVALDWAVYPLAAAIIVAVLLVLVLIVRAVMPIKFDITIHHHDDDDPPDDQGDMT